MPENNANDAVTTLAGAISAGALSLTLSSAAGTGPNPFPAAPFRIRIDSEIILVGARTGTACSSLTRGADATVAATHAAGATVRQILTVDGLADAIATQAGTADATYVTVDDESADLPNSRQLLAGTNITFDDTTPGERTVNASTGSGDDFPIVFSIGDGATPLTTGFKIFSNAAVRAGTIGSALLIANVSGNLTLDVLKTSVGTYPTTVSIVASAPPELSGADLSLDSTLTGWDPDVAVGDIFGFEITATDGVIAQITLTLQVAP